MPRNCKNQRGQGGINKRGGRGGSVKKNTKEAAIIPVRDFLDRIVADGNNQLVVGNQNLEDPHQNLEDPPGSNEDVFVEENVPRESIPVDTGALNNQGIPHLISDVRSYQRAYGVSLEGRNAGVLGIQTASPKYVIVERKESSSSSTLISQSDIRSAFQDELNNATRILRNTVKSLKNQLRNVKNNNYPPVQYGQSTCPVYYGPQINAQHMAKPSATHQLPAVQYRSPAPQGYPQQMMHQPIHQGNSTPQLFGEHTIPQPMQNHTIPQPMQNHTIPQPMQNHTILQPIQNHTIPQPIQNIHYIPQQQMQHASAVPQTSYVQPVPQQAVQYGIQNHQPPCAYSVAVQPPYPNNAQHPQDWQQGAAGYWQ